MNVRVDTLRLRIVGVDPARAGSIARLVAAELRLGLTGLDAAAGSDLEPLRAQGPAEGQAEGLAADLAAGPAEGIRAREARSLAHVSAEPVTTHATDTDAGLANRVATSITAGIRHEVTR